MLHVSAVVGPQQAFVSKHKYLLKCSMAHHFNTSFYYFYILIQSLKMTHRGQNM